MDTSTLHLPLRTLASGANAEQATIRDAHGQVLFTAPRAIAALIVAAANANQKMVDALRLIRNQCTGPDWTPEQALAFCKQHAGETIKAVDGARMAAVHELCNQHASVILAHDPALKTPSMAAMTHNTTHAPGAA